MTLDELKQILEMVREHELAEFEFEQEGVKLRLRKYAGSAPALVSTPAMPVAATFPANGAALPAPVALAVADPGAAGAGAAAGDAAAAGLTLVTSPIVGTFYRSPSPEAPPFVDVGIRVKKGQPLCIIEAMKLMNEIEAECDGQIVHVFVENGHPVQYGDKLFAIKC
jgi:acetyl-CoA carboxylase biotin carboxyl carrier protein